MVVLGYENTLPVTMEEMLHHCRAVARGALSTLLIGDLPFMSYQISSEEAVRNAGRFLQQGGMHAVKLEGGRESLDAIYASTRLHPDDVATLKKLVYANGSVWQLSDYPALLCQVPTMKRRVALARVLSRQSAVFAGLVIKPDTDVDKIAAYWGNVPNVRFTDIRPLL